MTNSLLIGKLIYQKLNQITTKVFPIVAENGTTYPYIVYLRNGIETITVSKDGYCEDSCSYSISIVSNKYDESVEIANEVRSIMEKNRLATDDLVIDNNRLVGASERFDNDAYIQELNFNCKISN